MLDFSRFYTAVLFLFGFCVAQAQSQEPVFLKNPSFEDFPRSAQQPSGWYDCGGRFFPGESAPDVQPSNKIETFFGVTKPANDGYTYLGMVARENDTNESVSQRLFLSIEGGTCYSFSIDLARSLKYKSTIRKKGNPSEESAEKPFTTPIVLRIWAGNTYCDKAELLGESARVSNSEWKQYDFKFEPSQSYKYIMLEAFYKTPTLFPYNGNLLLDNASVIVPIDCGNNEPLIAMNEVKKDPPKRVNQKPEKTNPKPRQSPKVENKPKQNPKVETKPKTPPAKIERPIAEAQTKTEPKVRPEIDKKPKKLAGLSKTDLKKGQTIRLDKLYFKADSFNITSNNYMVLDEVYDFLKENKGVTIEVGGHTNSNPKTHAFCDKLSSKRAKAVYDYLIRKGIPERRVSYKGYGKRNPIASNKTRAGRKRNQRVEIKILEVS